MAISALTTRPTRMSTFSKPANDTCGRSGGTAVPDISQPTLARGTAVSGMSGNPLTVPAGHPEIARRVADAGHSRAGQRPTSRTRIAAAAPPKPTTTIATMTHNPVQYTPVVSGVP